MRDDFKKCVDSILAQTYKDIEVILVDDGSKDQSGVICDDYKVQDDRIKVIHKQNGGVSTARNAGLRAAKGTYVQFVDSDDYLENNITESMVQVMEKEESDLVVCGYQRHEKNKVVDMVPNTVEKCRVSEMDLKVEKLFKNYYLNAPWNKLYRREHIKAGFREDYALAEDLLFNLQYIKGIKYVSFLEGVFYHYIVGDNDSLSKKEMENFLI